MMEKSEKKLLGAITGDVIGSVYEFHNERSTGITLFQPKTTFTDDSVLTVATMDVLLRGGDYTNVPKSPEATFRLYHLLHQAPLLFFICAGPHLLNRMIAIRRFFS
jgi:ADP-ribosylglycohydrolase